MPENLDPQLYDLLLTFAWHNNRRNRADELIAELDIRGDPRAPDVREVAGVVFDCGLERSRTAENYVVAEGGWWVVRRLPGGVTATIRPATVQRVRAERYGRVGMQSDFVDPYAVTYLREEAAIEGRDVTLADLEQLAASVPVTPESVREHVDACLAGLVLLQFGWTPRELRSYHGLVRQSPVSERPWDYPDLVRKEVDSGDTTTEYANMALFDELRNPAFVSWMEELYRVNKGRFWWVMDKLLARSPLRHEVGCRVLERVVRAGGLVQDDRLPR
ncbi:MAG: hypothetical protein ACKODX_18365 [Gemmata sp.]